MISGSPVISSRWKRSAKLMKCSNRKLVMMESRYMYVFNSACKMRFLIWILFLMQVIKAEVLFTGGTQYSSGSIGSRRASH